MKKVKKTHIGDQVGLKLADDDTPISKEEFEWRIRETKKCKDDIDYFVENYYHIINERGDKVVIKMFKKQRGLLHTIFDKNRIICLAARQTGKSETYSMFCVYQILFQKNYSILIAGNKGEIAREILGKIKNAYELVPNWMKPSIKIWNENKIKFDNGVTIKCTTTGPNSARGQTIDFAILDEFSFVLPSIQEKFFTSSVPTIESRPNSKLLVVSTPNGVGDKFHEIWKDATSNQNTVWSAFKIDWWERPDRDEAWQQKALKTLGSQEKFDQEYGNRFTVSAGDKLITDKRILELKSVVDSMGLAKYTLPVFPENPDDKTSYVEYFKYEKGKTYVAGIDCAEGTGRDSSVMYIFDITNTKEIKMCAKFDSSATLPEKFASVIYKLWCKYGHPKLMIEANSCGLAVIDDLRNISYRKELKDRFDMFDIINYNRPAGHTGIMSNNGSKSKSMLNIQSIVQSGNYGLILPDEELYKELPFCEKRSGSGNVTYRAAKNHHDDHILALTWGLFILHADNLEKYFSVGYETDEDTDKQYPSIILPLGEDVDNYKSKLVTPELSVEEAYDLAMKWKLLGDDLRASYILQTIYETETEDSAGNWGRNPFQIEQQLFSDGFRKKFFNGKYEDTSYFKGPFSDPSDSFDDRMPFGWDF